MNFGKSALAARRRVLAAWGVALCLLGCAFVSQAAETRTLSWKELLPPDWNSWHYFQNFYRLFPDVDNLEDDDPRAQAILVEMRKISSKVPSRAELHGQVVRIPGFISPLREGAEREIQEFLLVPYQGACIHRPPPPANQIVRVLPRTAVAAETVVRAVWVSGILEVRRATTALGSAAYQLRDAQVELVDWEKEGRQLLRYRIR